MEFLIFVGACSSLTHIHLYNVRQARNFWTIIRLYKYFYSTFGFFLPAAGEHFVFPPDLKGQGGGELKIAPPGYGVSPIQNLSIHFSIQ